MRVFRVLLCAAVALSCERLVGIEEALPKPQDAAADSGIDAADSAPLDAPADTPILPEAAPPNEHVPCEGTGCVCKKEPVAGAESQSFHDVLPTSLEAESVQKLHEAGIISGCDDNPPLFCPSCQLSRSAMVKWLVEALGVPLQEPDFETFDDVQKNHPFYGHIETAHALGIAEGYSDGMFYPNNPVTRASAAVMIARAASLAAPSPLPGTFSDVPPGFWAEDEIEALHLACVTTGCTADGTQYCPHKFMTRRGGVVMVARAFKLVQSPCAGPDP